jgi:hypothetical protein
MKRKTTVDNETAIAAEASHRTELLFVSHFLFQFLLLIFPSELYFIIYSYLNKGKSDAF